MRLITDLRRWSEPQTADRRGILFAVMLIAMVVCLRYAAHYAWSRFAPLETIVVGGGGMLAAIGAMILLWRRDAVLTLPLVLCYSIAFVAAFRSLAAWR